jgi:LytS/YehU family sensor histidine kinase
MPSGHLREINPRFGVFPFVSTFCIVWVVSSGLRLLKEWQKSEQRLKKSEHERLNAELNQLKSQINPHFLFNTLNGIYTMTVLKNEAAPQTIIQLSNLMSYVLGEAGADYVSLKKDIDHLQAFIELNRLRLTEKSPVTFTLEGNIDGLSIAPLLLLPFVENAFKYGVSNSVDSPIDISLKIIGKQLHFTCKNQIFRYDVEIPAQHGIGIANTRRRLALMYPDQYNLQVLEAPFTYEVALQLDLSGLP